MQRRETQRTVVPSPTEAGCTGELANSFMAQILGMLSRQFSPLSGKTEPALPEARPEPLEKYCFHVHAVDGSAFTMEVLAPDADVATRFVKRYPGIVSFEPIGPEGTS
jgi:hypothetical protein